MNTKRWLMIAAGVVLLLLLGAFAFDQASADKVGKGVTIGGVDVSGLSREQAERRVAEQVNAPLGKPLTVTYRGETLRLTPKASKVSIDTEGLVDQAIQQSNSGFFVASAVKRAVGVDNDLAIRATITYDKRGVEKYVARVKREFDQPPKDASIAYYASHIKKRKAQPGIGVKRKKFKAAVIARLKNPTLARRVPLDLKQTEPKITKKQLARKYKTILLVDREHFKLRLLKRLKVVKTYGIAVGQSGLETPKGLYAINSRQVNPAWHVPNSAWAGKLAGKVIPPGPGNPLVARWLGIADGVGIHGTDSPGSIGSAASHGCIRMVPAQVIELYPRVPLGTPVYIG